MIGTAREQVGHVLALAQSIGALAALKLVICRALGRARPVAVPCGPHRLWVRPTDSDPYVLAQIFTAGEYDAPPYWMTRLQAHAAELRAAGGVPLIIDAGANVGYSALYLADRFPDAIVIAVEPDAGCVEILRRNCAVNSRIHPVRAALWSHDRGVDLVNRDHGSWANRVADGGSTTPSVTLDQLIAQVAEAAPLIVKLDIEGAETEVCAASPQAIASFACIMIEPHDWMLPGSGGLSPLYAAMAGKKVDTVIRDETMMFFDCAVLAAAVAT
ncbi:FkbM family methyltransferase [Mycobacterium sp. SMC-4]|uniref:FkbM family methyltransferase n=1 Tax=Mycobacterium sp. SMC-4 TaxID=2857059 RepID=UPI0021B47F2B|nr:FkbM family methyltransferase [Mycobacterium sp. SMC-4]UXA20226.1 FkbM family methyltransferase [Mycobacterium sp. SMC-4]